MTAVLGYVRVSSAEQAGGGYSLATQEAQIRKTCEQRQWTLLKVFRDEALSGKSLERPALLDALELVAAGVADGLVVAKLDRLTRSVIDFGLLLEWFQEANATLVALDLSVDTSTPAGKLVANVMASVAEWERATISQRTRDGLAQRRAQGKPISGPSIIDRPELAELIIGMRESGMSLRAICRMLEAEGVPTLRGGAEWRPSSVEGILGYVRRPARRRGVRLPEIGR